MDKSYRISIIIVSYDKRINFLKKVLSSLERQTYNNIEIIIIGNGFTNENDQYLKSWSSKNSNFIYYNFSENCHDNFDHSKIGRKRYQYGIDISSGSLIFCQSDDDLLNNDYFQKIVNLFKNNPKCLTAIGIPGQYIWDENKFIEPIDGDWQKREKYCSGKEAVIKSYTNPTFSLNPGFCYVFKKNLLKEIGDDIWYGYDTSILLSLVSMGVTGFDKEAKMYWGRHSSDRMNDALNNFNSKYFIYSKQWKIRDKLAIKIWTKLYNKNDVYIMKKLIKRELAISSVTGIKYSIKNINFILFLKHLLIIMKNDIFVLNRLLIDIYHSLKRKINEK